MNIKKLSIKSSIVVGVLLLALSSHGLTQVHALDTTAPAPITTNVPVYTSPTVECGQTGSNGQQLTAAQCAQQVTSDSKSHIGIVIAAGVIALALVAVIIVIIIFMKKRPANTPTVQQAIAPNPINPINAEIQPSAQQVSQTPVQPVPQPLVEPIQNNLPPNTPTNSAETF